MKLKNYRDKEIDAVRELISMNERKMARDRETLQIYQTQRSDHLQYKGLLENDRIAINSISRRLYCLKVQGKILQKELSRLIKIKTVI